MTRLTHLTRRIALIAAGTAVLPLALTACGSGDDDSSSSSKAPASHSPSAMPSKSPAMSEPFGAACSSVPKSGPGSFSGMATDPVATAASHNPVLSTLVSAVQKAGLVDTLNSAQNITVFAPTNDAFAKLPKDQLDAAMKDKAMLTKILTHHVVGQKLAPADLSDGTFTTLEKGKITTAGSGESYKVDGTANVVCGNVHTANATVYIVDSVLMPKS
ncbi:fasciclin domain-containing protein [Streptomyces sp. TS71-3]|uniref:fasciclin domain-containing protein n=1 Tax=Streptomyces sp. TS71-3 TaxID=2733862 RepID=UPI001B2D3FD6|nr:fasciclin domain-containing protein [Streptomyces sp. TS71-3]GHJ37136.1 lipoprotein [Streptomyces sp. TS71-3]